MVSGKQPRVRVGTPGRTCRGIVISPQHYPQGLKQSAPCELHGKTALGLHKEEGSNVGSNGSGSMVGSCMSCKNVKRRLI